MTERLHESLSALMDDEADELEVRRILAHTNCEEIDAIWSRYHLAQSSHQVEEPVLHLDISERVSAAIAEESIQQASPAVESHSSKTLNWLKPVSGFAVAASVAAAVVVGVRGYENAAPGLLPQDVTQTQQIASSRAYPVGAGSFTASTGAKQPGAQFNVLPSPSQTLLKQQSDQRMEKYLLRHTQQLSASQTQGVIPFARVASFEAE